MIRIGGYGLLLAMGLIFVSPWVSSVVDVGPRGESRISIFPVALAVFDPLVLECVRNSVIQASLITFGSLAVGVWLGHVLGTRRFWGRGPLWALMLAPMAAGPLLIAPGILLLIGGPRAWEWLAARSFLDVSFEILAQWLALIWVGLAWGTPMVALATEAASRRVDLTWLEAARAVGGSRVRAWRDVAWPIVRPEAARAAARVFCLALVEPVGPLILGLRRTLAVQMLEAAQRLDQPTRAAILASLSIGIAVVGRAILVRWGGRSLSLPDLGAPATPVSIARPRGMVSLLILAGWSLFAAGPVGALLWEASDPAQGVSLGRWGHRLIGWTVDPKARTWAINGLMLGGLALGVNLVILSTIRRSRGGFARGMALLIEVVPPMALAVGAYSLPWLIGILASRTSGEWARWLGELAIELSTARAPGYLLIAAVAAGRLPSMVQAACLARGRSSPLLIEASRQMGASKRRALKDGGPGIYPLGSLILSFAIGSTAIIPALLLAPGSERQTLALAVLGSLRESGSLLDSMAGPIAAIFLVNAVGLAVASRSRPDRFGAWSRG